jgi:hypothetical protein
MLNLTFAKIAIKESLRDLVGIRHSVGNISDHLQAAMAWLALAQDQTGNGGVSAGFGRLGWLPDYPETTGYIIPTFLRYLQLSGESTVLERARRMGDYELGVQMETGAIPGGFFEPRVPCVFDTGQVIFGWLALFQETDNPAYILAARTAGDWLLSVQASDGSWPRCDYANSARTYHARVAWALAALGQVSHEPRFVEAARRQVRWTIANQKPNGWFALAELGGQRFPVTHTIAYTTRGVLECGISLQEERFISAAHRTADALLDIQLQDGALYGAYDSTWKPTVKWRCLVGCAQMSLIWLRLYQLTGDARYGIAAERMNKSLRQTQDLETDGPVRGAIKGSWPFYGGYLGSMYPNWATKFFADALMLEQELQIQQPSTHSRQLWNVAGHDAGE